MAGDIFNGWPEDGEPVPRLQERLRAIADDLCMTNVPLNEAADRLDVLEKALIDIIRMKSCLLAEAKEIAKEGLRETR